MKTAKDFLKQEVEKQLSSARDITRKAEDENRALSPEERELVEGHVKEATTLKARVQELEDNDSLQEQIKALSVNAGSDKPVEKARKNRTIGDAFVESDAYKALLTQGLVGNWATGPVEIEGFKAFGPGGRALYKTVGDNIVDEASSDNELLGAPQVVDGIVPRLTGIEPYKLVVADLFGAGTATTNSIVFLIESLVDDDAYVVAEKAEKPDSYMEFDKTTVSVEKLATFLAISDEMLEDAPQAASYINGRLALFVRRAEEAFLLAKLDDSVSQTAAAADIGGTNIFDAIYAGIVDVRRNGGLEPDSVLIHPVDDAEMTISKTAVDGQYFSGGPYASPSANPWGLRKVVTAAVTQGVAVVGAFREGATVWRRGGLTVDASNSHADFFRKNLTALRAEERLALTVYRPNAFSYVTIP